MRQRVQLDGQPATVIRLRQPQWAAAMAAIDATGVAVPLVAKDGYYSTTQPMTNVEFIYFGDVYAEGRHCNHLSNGPVAGQSVVLGYGPKIFAAEDQSVILSAWPTTIAALTAQGLEPFSPVLRGKKFSFVFNRSTTIVAGPAKVTAELSDEEKQSGIQPKNNLSPNK